MNHQLIVIEIIEFKEVSKMSTWEARQKPEKYNWTAVWYYKCLQLVSTVLSH